jgi:hypothetical protein
MAHDPSGDLGAFIDRARRSLFRLETLDLYDVASDGGDFLGYMRGEDGPDPVRKAAWHKVLKADRDRGVSTRRVHVVRSPLTDYLRYEFEWGYAHNIAYEDIRILDMAERGALASLETSPDYWLIDGHDAAVMHYGDGGRYLGFTVAAPGAAVHYAQAAEIAWEAAEPFAAWWDNHRQFWRASRQAA